MRMCGGESQLQIVQLVLHVLLCNLHIDITIMFHNYSE